MAEGNSAWAQWRRVLPGLRSEWREIGGLGRFALAGLLLSVGLTIVLGFSIGNAARSHLLTARADLVAADVATLPSFPEATDSEGRAAFNDAIHHSLMGGETERVKVWAADGRIVYSDDGALAGTQFELSVEARAAFRGEIATTISDLQDPAHADAAPHSQLIEIYVPVGSQSERLVVEVEQRLDSLNEALGNIRRNVWLSIAAGMSALAMFLGALGIARSRAVDRRRRQAERLLGALFRAQEDEQRRIVGALHDDVGQPLYRLLYGLEGSRAKLGPDDPVADELDRLEGLVRQIDATLRGELDALHHGLAADAGLIPALRDLASATEAESGIDVRLSLPERLPSLSAVARTALFRAAQEAAVNVRKHAGASAMSISADSAEGRVSVEVRDDGRGIGTDRGLGLTTTRERLEALGGGLTVRRVPAGGTVFLAWMPLAEERAG